MIVICLGNLRMILYHSIDGAVMELTENVDASLERTEQFASKVTFELRTENLLDDGGEEIDKLEEPFPKKCYT